MQNKALHRSVWHAFYKHRCTAVTPYFRGPSLYYNCEEGLTCNVYKVKDSAYKKGGKKAQKIVPQNRRERGIIMIYICMKYVIDIYTVPNRNEYTPGTMSSISMPFLTNIDYNYLHQILIYHSFGYSWCLSSIKFPVLLLFFSADVIIRRSHFTWMSTPLRILLNNIWLLNKNSLYGWDCYAAC